MPLSEYDFVDSIAVVSLLNHARDISVGKCMETRGFEYSASGVQNAPESNIGDRVYGIWNVEKAQLYGFGFAIPAKAQAMESDFAAGGESWMTAYEACGKDISADISPYLPDNEELTDSLVPRLRTEAYNLASAEPSWQQAREDWWACLREEGLTPRTEASAWSSQQANELLGAPGGEGRSADKEEEIRIATIEATCNMQTRLAQRLGDLEAGYQEALIAQNQAALNELKTKNQERFVALQAYVARAG